ncbi:MAG: glycosyltransferase family 4 protein [Bacteroidales bacterium]|nr:glycosyltransferase family 4 protein [Bacteroidales bacterium]
MNKEFFLVTQVFYPDEVSTAGLFTQLCTKLASQDVNVTVWCAQPGYNVKAKQPARVLYKNIQIRYLPSTNFSKNSTTGRLINYLTFSLSLLVKLLFSKNKIPVFTSTNPPYLGFLIALICSVKKRHFNYIIQDIFPDGLVRLGKLKPKSIAVKWWSKANRYTLKKSSKIIVIGRDMIPWIKKTYAAAELKSYYIPIWQDENLIQPQVFTGNPFVNELGLNHKFVVQYSGNMGLWNHMMPFGEAANILNDNEICFMFVGGGIKLQELKNSINPGSKTNIKFLPFQPSNQLKNTLSACHVALVSLKEGLEGIAVPSKIMGILAAGIPVIAAVPDESEIAKIITEVKCGYVINPNDSAGIAQAVNKLKNDSGLRKSMGQNARQAFLGRYCLHIITKKYLELL